MNPNTWMLFALAYLLATLTPGPNVLLVVKNGLQLEQQLPHLQRVIHESSLVLHRDQLPPLPLNAM